MINYDVPINSIGMNSLIRGCILDEETMNANGFFYKNNRWSYINELGYEVWLFINISEESIFIEVIDGDFGQPYDYQRLLKINPESIFASKVHVRVQSIMEKLSIAGIIKGYIRNDYI